MSVVARLRTFARCWALFHAAVAVLLLRWLKPLHFLYPRGLKETVRTWTPAMLWVPIKSLGRRIHVDQPCGYTLPLSFAPRCEVSPEYRLSEADVRHFYERGYLGPFRAISEAEMAALKPHLEEQIKTPSATYGFATTRDLHLDSPCVARAVLHPAVVERVAQLMGPDLIVWRSNVFEKRGGSPEITWHQGTTFLMEQLYKPAFEPTDLNTIFEVGVWMAVDEATLANGCMQVLPGTHDVIGTIRLTGTKQFLGQTFEGDYHIEPDMLVPLPCKAGEFWLFTERLIHGSEPNRSNLPRMSLVFRFLTAETPVYRGETTHRVNTLRKVFPLDRWAAVLARGQAPPGVNKTVSAAQLLEQPAAVEHCVSLV